MTHTHMDIIYTHDQHAHSRTPAHAHIHIQAWFRLVFLHGNPLNLFSSHTELGGLVRLIVSAAVHGKTRWRTDFHGSLDNEMCEVILFSNTQIEISINWCIAYASNSGYNKDHEYLWLNIN